MKVIVNNWIAEEFVKGIESVQKERLAAQVHNSHKYRIKYLRDSKRHPYGTFTSIIMDDKLYVGWSLCHKNDDFDKREGRNWANRRASRTDKQAVPASILKEFIQFVKREKRYYDKDKIENRYYVEQELFV